MPRRHYVSHSQRRQRNRKRFNALMDLVFAQKAQLASFDSSMEVDEVTARLETIAPCLRAQLKAKEAGLPDRTARPYVGRDSNDLQVAAKHVFSMPMKQITPNIARRLSRGQRKHIEMVDDTSSLCAADEAILCVGRLGQQGRTAAIIDTMNELCTMKYMPYSLGPELGATSWTPNEVEHNVQWCEERSQFQFNKYAEEFFQGKDAHGRWEHMEDVTQYDACVASGQLEIVCKRDSQRQRKNEKRAKRSQNKAFSEECKIPQDLRDADEPCLGLSSKEGPAAAENDLERSVTDDRKDTDDESPVIEDGRWIRDWSFLEQFEMGENAYVSDVVTTGLGEETAPGHAEAHTIRIGEQNIEVVHTAGSEETAMHAEAPSSSKDVVQAREADSEFIHLQTTMVGSQKPQQGDLHHERLQHLPGQSGREEKYQNTKEYVSPLKQCTAGKELVCIAPKGQLALNYWKSLFLTRWLHECQDKEKNEEEDEDEADKQEKMHAESESRSAKVEAKRRKQQLRRARLRGDVAAIAIAETNEKRHQQVKEDKEMREMEVREREQNNKKQAALIQKARLRQKVGDEPCGGDGPFLVQYSSGVIGGRYGTQAPHLEVEPEEEIDEPHSENISRSKRRRLRRQMQRQEEGCSIT